MKRAKTKVLLLHGFGGAGADWKPFQAALGQAFESYAPTLPGHHGAPSLHSLGISSPLAMAKYLAGAATAALGHCHYIVGYSLGGRLALLMAAELEPRGVVLLSAGIGMGSHKQKAERRAGDRQSARRLRRDPQAFWRYWYDQPLFASLGKRERARLELARQGHDPLRLAEALECLSPGNHPYLARRLGVLGKFLYCSGALDAKYAALAEQLRRRYSHGSFREFPAAGHSLLFERPQECAMTMRHWIKGGKP